MVSETLCSKEVELLGDKYVIYLKRVPTRVGSGGIPQSTAVRAFVKKQ